MSKRMLLAALEELDEIKEEVETPEVEETTPNLADSPDIIKMSVPLLMRLFEYCKEDAKSDVELHRVVENIIKQNAEKDVLDMGVYEQLTDFE